MEQETIRIMCPNVVCKRVLAVPLTARGRQVRCRFCGTSLRIPAKKDPPKTAPADGAEAPDAPDKKKGAQAA